ncbi:MFS transporter [Herbaspirillum sp.]|jgi:AAHS family 4-hydroxybenzoate transporter-like MFS transporter|uniref:MFS transporter n=1 Tax=Herbaspirillum TaxID=963 RepID=UPI0025829763|nr:aromatic acid/H+ symport family MFS transporter [Herbaspirillum sp.]MCP3655606.1 aromatic acid/H+ symport family MFS transporter [Herbaspirillum sp.]MCP3945375.1 aromatic acid/H+ symport family MFS transporter [Herbaspirillum sp.]MCP4034108.1 aromatic acid/H+ symport family MFS transporter [Herbaspirillum sp.]MCP4034467.1 aromatic acid/H+ symport family MFS transporter [Herbaspirillum sp.]MCP4555349.1 aromatic acid/H+ symport family MFS transporter [Herbaspirillum sp.]
MNTAQSLDVRSHINGRKMSGYQWLLLILCFLIVATDGMDVAIMGFLAPAITKEWGISRAAFGVVMSAAPIGLAVGALLVGPLSDRYGRKKLLMTAVAWFGACSLACAFAQDVVTLSALRFLTGLGLGAAMPNATTLLSEYVPERSRSTLLAIMFTGFNLGSGLVGFLAAALLPEYGWRTVLMAGGAIPLLCLPFYLWLVPESARFMVVRHYPADRIARTLARVCGGHFAAGQTFSVSEPPVKGGQPAKVLLSETYRKTTLSLWGTYFMGLLVIYLLSGWLPTLIKDAGLPIEKAASITALFQLGGTVGALVVGFLMDRWSPSRAIACAYIAGAVFILLLASGSVQSGMFAAYVLLAGFCMSGAQTGLNAFAPSCYPTVVRATGVSWMLGVGRFGSILGSFAGGVLLSMGWGFGAVIAILAVPATLAALIIVFIQMGQRPAAAV